MEIDKLGRISVALLKNVCTQHMPLSCLDRQSRANNLYSAIAQELTQLKLDYKAQKEDLQQGR
jgi:hypothetical protein